MGSTKADCKHFYQRGICLGTYVDCCELQTSKDQWLSTCEGCAYYDQREHPDHNPGQGGAG